MEFGISDPVPYYYLTLAAVVLAVAMTVRLNGSRVGRGWIAVREDEDAAELMGVPTYKLKLWAFAMGAAVGGLAGWIYASRVSFISPDNFPFFFSVLILAAVVLGGMGSIPGVIAGAFSSGSSPNTCNNPQARAPVLSLNTITRLPGQSNVAEYRDMLFGLALVLVMIFRPQGLIPSRRRAAELAEAGQAAGRSYSGRRGPSARPPTRPAVVMTTRCIGGTGDGVSEGVGVGACPLRSSTTGTRPMPQRSPNADDAILAASPLKDVSPHDPTGRDLRDHRPERRRQDDDLQLHHRRV